MFQKQIKGFAQLRLRSLPGVDACEIEQELMEVLWRCTLTYNPDHGAKFSTYFWTLAERRWIDLHRAASRKMRVGDYYREWLEAEDVRDEVMDAILTPTAEDEALANIRVIEIFRSAKR